MKNILKYFFGAALVGLTALSCVQEKFEGANGDIPVASEYADAIVIDVDQTTNTVTFSLNATGVMPVWYINGSEKPTSTVNGYQQIFTSAGDYEVIVKIMNKNGVSDGSITRTFNIENTIFDFTMYYTFLCGTDSKEWHIDGTIDKHMGCGESGSDGLNWWAASAGDKTDVGLYETTVTFDLNNQYTITPGSMGIYVNYGTEALNTTGATSDFNLAIDPQTVEYSFEVDGDDLYIVLPANTYFPYIANDDIWTNPRYKVTSITSKKLCLLIDSGSIAWAYTLTSVVEEEEETFGGFVYDSEYNMWTKATIADPYFWYAPGWSQIDDPTCTIEDGTYTVVLPSATTDQWQAQMHLATDISVNSSTNYDFSCILNLTQAHSGVTVKLTDSSNDSNYFFADRVSVEAYEDYVFYYSDMPGIDASTVTLVFDFGGNADNTTAVIKNIVLKDHADDDGSVIPEVSEDTATWVDGEENLWTNADKSGLYFWYANTSWSQIDDPAYTIGDDGSYTFVFPTETNSQWQAQVHIPTDIVTSADKNYDFKCTILSNNSFTGATIKLHLNGDDNTYYFADRVALEAYEEYEYMNINMSGIDMSAAKLVFDFGGCPDNTTVKVSDIVLQEHAE